MIISEVLDAIDNINSITIESEISMYESLLSSYDKMLLIEEHYEGDDINDFKIFQEGVLSDAKDDVKKQNEGKSTLNKILFTIPRMIAAIVKQIINLLKGTKKKAEDIDKRTKALPKEKKSLLAKLFPKKEDGKADVKKIVRNLVIGGASVAVAKGVFDIGSVLIITNANINELRDIAVKYAKLTDKDKQKEFKNKFKKVLMIYQNSYSKIIKQHGDQIGTKDIINDIKKDTEVCNAFNEMIGSYKDDLKNIFNNIFEYIKGLSNFDPRTESTDSLTWRVGCIVGIIYNCITDGSKLPVGDLEKIAENIGEPAEEKTVNGSDDAKTPETDVKNDDEKIKERLAKIEKLAEDIKNNKKYQGIMLAYDENAGFIIKDTKKRIDHAMKMTIFYYGQLDTIATWLINDKKIEIKLVENGIKEILKNDYSDSDSNKINIPSNFKYSDDGESISNSPVKITNFLSNSEYIKNCDSLIKKIEDNIGNLGKTNIVDSIKDEMVDYKIGIKVIQEIGTHINDIIQRVNDFLTRIDGGSSNKYKQIDSQLLDKNYDPFQHLG